jgi:N-glycosylase/DNA lyase
MKELLNQYNNEKTAIKSRLKDFSSIKNQEYFYEACFCLLTPQSNAKKCDECIQILKKKDFQFKNFEIRNILKTKTRFYNNKSNYLKLLKTNWKNIKPIINKEPIEAREFLVNNVKGLGYKESSHFLRNIGKRNLAILDRHILTNLVKYKVIKELPKTLTKNKYLEIENKFKNFSNKINIPMDELDLLFWSMQTGEIFK